MNWLVFLFLSFVGYADSKPDLKIKTCSAQINLLLAKYTSTNQWRQTAPLEPDTVLYRSPTRQLGQWLEVQTGKDESLQKLHLLTKESSKFHLFKKDCTHSVALKNHVQKQKPNSFTDKDLQNVLNKSTGALIYLWSPGMVYSFKESRVFKNAAKQLKLEFISLVDPNANDRLLKGVVPKEFAFLSRRKNTSIELQMRGATIHYPSVIVVFNKKLSREPIVGVYTEDLLKAKILTKMDELK